MTPELVAFAVQDSHYKDMPSRIMAISDAFNEELHDLADAGCPVIQMEEPQIHLLAARGIVDAVINPEFMLKVFNNTVKGLRAKTEVWCHTCWGNPSQQRMFAKVQSLQAGARDAQPGRRRRDHVRDASSGAVDLEAIGEQITDKKIGIGVIDHHTLQVESPAGGGRSGRARALSTFRPSAWCCAPTAAWAAKGMSRRHAFYKMVSLVQGTNIVRKELGLPQAECLAADPRYSLIRS